jgi:hypothetical protein
MNKIQFNGNLIGDLQLIKAMRRILAHERKDLEDVYTTSPLSLNSKTDSNSIVSITIFYFKDTPTFKLTFILYALVSETKVYSLFGTLISPSGILRI